MKYDTLLKQLFRSWANSCVPAIAGSRPTTELTIDLGSVTVRKPDMLLRLEDGRLLHIELQTRNDPKMPARMLVYLALLNERFPTTAVLQLVVYFGREELSMASSISSEGLEYRYQVVDIRAFDPEEFLRSPAPGDRILAILCRGIDTRRIIQRIYGSWSDCPPNQQRDLIEQLVIASELRRLENTVIDELDIIAGQKALEKWHERCRVSGALYNQRANTIRLLERRFGPLAAWVTARINTTPMDTLEIWFDRILDVQSVEELIGPAPNPENRPQ